jgi:hypothetical protein
MKNAELKEVLMSQEPVTHNGIEYKRVSAIIYRNEGGKLYVQAELLDKNANSVSIASPDRITRKNE